MRPAIVVQGVGKQFSRRNADRPITFMEAALRGWKQVKPQQNFIALEDINLTVYPGEMVGIIGSNGAGKSTLLNLIGGVGQPDRGQIRINGRIGALLEIGAGFHGDLTGRENVFVGGVVAGLTRREVAERLDSIVEFAELQAFIDSPLRTYSTGMQMRLGFAVAIHTNPQVLLVDEFLSVGDLSFQSKCLKRITKLKEQGCSIVWVSHDPEQVGKLCDQVLWLRRGKIVAHGDPRVVVGQYKNEMRMETLRRTPDRPPKIIDSDVELKVNQNRFGSLEVEIVSVCLLPSNRINSGDSLIIEIEYFSSDPIQAPIFNVSFHREDGQTCFESNTLRNGFFLPQIQGSGKLRLKFERLDLSGGSYFVNVSIHEQNWDYAYDYHWHAYKLTIQSATSANGILSPPCTWSSIL